jgi:hypothetical protein
MNCDLACHLMDDYLEKRLSRYEARRLERHLALCPRCARELEERPYFERAIRHTLAASVEGQHLSAEASMRIVQAAQGNMRRAVWSHRAGQVARIAASAAALCLVLVGLLVLLSGFPGEADADTTILSPTRYLAPTEPQPASHLVVNELTRSGFDPRDLLTERAPAVSLGPNDVVIEPWTLQPGEPFTITLFLHADLPQPLTSARFDFDVNGPTGYYHFEMTVRGPLLPRGVSVLQITPATLAASSREKYLLSPSEIFGEPGVYTIQILLFSPVFADAH